MPGHLLLYHPGVRKLKEIVDSGELGDVLYVYGNRQNLGTIRPEENALGSLGVHDLSVILLLLGEEPGELWARGESFLKEGVEDVVFCYLRFPSGKVAHMHLSWLDPHKMRRMTVVGSEKMAVFDDMELDRKVTVYDSAAEQSLGTYGEWRTRSGDIYSPRVANDEPLRLECRHFLSLVGGSRRTQAGGQGRGRSRQSARAAPALARAAAGMTAVAASAVVHEGTQLGEDVTVEDHAVVGKQPTLGRRSTAKRDAAADPLVVGAGSAILAGAVVFAGSTLGSGVIVGDQACVRERCTIGDDVVIGRGAFVENDVVDRRTVAGSRRMPT